MLHVARTAASFPVLLNESLAWGNHGGYAKPMIEDNKKNDLSFSGRLTPRKMRAMTPSNEVKTLTVSSNTFFHRKLADELAQWPRIKEVLLWGTVSKAALQRLLSLAEIHEIYVMELHKHGNLCGIDQSSSLRVFRGGWLSARDLRALTQLQNLETLSAQNSSVNQQVIEMIVKSSSLTNLDLEASNLDDVMAKELAKSSKITQLDVGATRLGPSGLQEICKMTQLRELDIWALDLDEHDLDCLEALPNLEYLSVGGYDSQERLKSKNVLAQLAKLPSLRRVWLDGIPVSESEANELRARYENAQITFAA